MNLIQQSVAVVGMSLRSLPERLGSSSVIVIGIAGVVAVLICVLAMTSAVSSMFGDTGSEGRALVVRKSALTEASSILSSEAVQNVMSMPGVRKLADGTPAGSGEMLATMSIARPGSRAPAGIAARGVSAAGLAIRPEIKLIDGRMFKPGVQELIVGRAAQQQFPELAIGGHVRARDAEWAIVGTFESGGDLHESELLTDAATLMSAFRRASYTSVTVLLDTPDVFPSFKGAVDANQPLPLRTVIEKTYYSRQADRNTTLLKRITYAVGAMMALGALFAAINTMYTAVSTRSIEIATLRAIGFQSSSVVLSVLAEALLLALLGAVLGTALAWIFFQGTTITTVGAGVDNEAVFVLNLSPYLLLLGVAAACVVGLLGGLFPAVRAATLPVANALRDV